MLELGAEGPRLHRELAEAVDGAGVDVVFACGELMGALYAGPAGKPPGRLCRDARRSFSPSWSTAVGPGDVIMVKGSLGSRMAPLVEALKRRFEAESMSA